MRQKKTIIMIVMCVAILFMSIGYALLSTKINIGGSTTVTSTWKVEFSSIRTVETKGGATNKKNPQFGATTATFEVDLVSPGDYIVYEIDITNYGDIDAEVRGATYSVTGSEAIYVQVSDVRKGTIIGSCEGLDVCPTVTLTLKVGYDGTVTADPDEKRKDIEVILDISQYVEGNPTPDGELVPQLTTKSTLVQHILNDNNVQSDVGIDFSLPSSDTNGNGLYYTSTNTENNRITYYFRGNIDNNYVKFAGYYWRIVRINEDGSTRMVYQGETADNTNPVVNATFNSIDSANSDIGYMFGDRSASSYELAHQNINDSDIKKAIDKWYENNLKDYTSYLADAGFCNDRSKASTPNTWASNDTALGYGYDNTYYGTYNRLNNLHQPQFACPNEKRDLFTTANSSKGNKALMYPVGLLTADEVWYAGTINYLPEGENDYSTHSYINQIPGGVTMSPSHTEFMYDNFGYVLSANEPRHTGSGNLVINLKSSVMVASGNGTQGSPYIIEVNQ